MINPSQQQKMVGKLEAELEGYEEISGRHFPAERPANFQVRVLYSYCVLV